MALKENFAKGNGKGVQYWLATWTGLGGIYLKQKHCI